MAVNLKTIKRTNADSCSVRDAMLALWSEAGKDQRDCMRHMPLINEQMERKAEWLMRKQLRAENGS